MIKQSIALIGISCLLVVSFFLGRWTTPPTDTTPVTPAVAEQLAVSSSALVAVTAPPAPQIRNSSKSQARTSYQADLDQLVQLKTLAQTAPAAALEQTAALRGELKSRAQAEILALWAKRDPQAAWNWLATYQPHNNPAFITLLTNIGIDQPQAALDMTVNFAQANPSIKKDIYQAALKGLAQGGAYDSASFLIEYLDDQEGIKGDLISQLAGDWALYEPEAALQWLRAQADQPVTVMGRLAAVWAETDPGAATQFAAQQPAVMREQLLTQSFKHWVSSDAANASAWLAAQPATRDLDPLINQWVEQTSADPIYLSQSLTIAGRMTDPEARINTLLGILSPLRQRDAAAATAQIASLQYLSATEQQRLRNELALAR